MVETLNVISVQFLHLISKSIASFIGPNIIWSLGIILSHRLLENIA